MSTKHPCLVPIGVVGGEIVSMVAFLSACVLSFCSVLLVVPVVSVTAHPRRGTLMGPVTLTCVVTKGNPRDYRYSWSFDNMLLINEQTNVYRISRFGFDSIGIYTCSVTNTAGIGRGATTLEVEGIIVTLLAH